MGSPTGIGLYDPVHRHPGRGGDHDTAQSRVLAGSVRIGHVAHLFVEVERKPAVGVVVGIDRKGAPVSWDNYFGHTGSYDPSEEVLFPRLLRNEPFEFQVEVKISR